MKRCELQSRFLFRLSHPSSSLMSDKRLLRGVIFDLDGTLVDSRLDFEAIRRDMGLPSGVPILEAVEQTESVAERERLQAILHRHELTGAEQATLFEGVSEFLLWLKKNGLPRAVLTRNSRASTEIVLARLGLQFDMVLTREDAPPKPDPAGLLLISQAWNIPPAELLFCGDYLFDLEAGSRAGMLTALFAPAERPRFAIQADYVLKHFSDAAAWLDQHFEIGPAEESRLDSN